MHRFFDDLECHKGRQFEILETDADLGVRNEIKGPEGRTQRYVSFGNWPSSTGSHLS
jgi:hypothetical protein